MHIAIVSILDIPKGGFGKSLLARDYLRERSVSYNEERLRAVDEKVARTRTKLSAQEAERAEVLADIERSRKYEQEHS